MILSFKIMLFVETASWYVTCVAELESARPFYISFVLCVYLILS